VTSSLSLPDSPLCAAAADLARRHEHPAIADHSVRTFLHAELAAEPLGLRAGADYDVEELFVACVLHDIGTADPYNGRQRFEVDGADGAAGFLESWGAPAAARRRVWEAIALHTSPGIAERLGPLTRLTRAGVVSDFATTAAAPSGVSTAKRREIESRYPRDDIERHLADAVIAQAVADPAKAPRSSWPGGLLRAHLADPYRDGTNPAF
jgi:HD domain